MNFPQFPGVKIKLIKTSRDKRGSLEGKGERGGGIFGLAGICRGSSSLALVNVTKEKRSFLRHWLAGWLTCRTPTLMVLPRY